MARSLVLLLLAGMALAACVAEPEPPAATSTPTASRTPPTDYFTIASPAFAHAGAIPREHSCDAEELSPPLVFGQVPLTATHLALIMEDPDAPTRTIVHWTFWNLPFDHSELAKAANVTSFGATEGQPYVGPCPPVGQHRYFFYAYATNGTVDLGPEASTEDVREALEARAEAKAEMYGTYFRPSIRG